MNKNDINEIFQRADRHVNAFRSTLLDASPFANEELPDFSVDELKSYFKLLPEDVQEEASENGLDDGLFLDDVYFFFKAHQNLFKKVS